MAKKSHTKAYSEFEQVMERSLHLVSLHKTLEGQFKGAIDLSDLLRAAIVLGVAAMDAYFTNVFAEKLVPYLKKKKAGDSMIRLLSDAGLDTSVALELLPMDRPYRRIRRLIDAHFELATTQQTDAIDELFLAFGIKDFSKSAEGVARRNGLLTRIRNVVTRRNAIVHDGDLNAHGKLKEVVPVKCRNGVQEIVRFVSAADQLVVKILP